MTRPEVVRPMPQLTDAMAADLLEAGDVSEALVEAAVRDRTVDARLVQLWADRFGDPDRELTDEEHELRRKRLEQHREWIAAWHETRHERNTR